MKKRIIVLALIVTLLCSGCGSKIPTLSNGDEAVVTLKDDSKISVNELYESVKDEYALNALITLVDKKILEKEYEDRIEEAKKYATNIVEQWQTVYGDNFEAAIQQQYGYSTAEGFEEYVYISRLRNFAMLDYAKKQISDKEVNKYYKDEIVGDIKVSQILITANVTDGMTDEEKETAEKEAKEKVEAIIAELNKTNKKEVADKFAELAKEQSQDETSKENGGSLGFINKNTLSAAYDELVKTAYTLKDGEYSTKVITTELGYHVILRTESKEKAALDEVKEDILETLSTEYLNNNSVAQVKALQEIRKDYKLEIVDSELKSQYATLIQNQLTSAQQQDQQTSSSN